VAEFPALHLSPEIAAAVTRLGWTADDPVMRDAAPTVARGHNLVALLPPIPAAATPVLAGLLSRLGDGTTGVLLTPEGELDEWAGRLHLLAAHTGVRLHVARGIGRAARRLRTDEGIHLLVCSPQTALALHRRSSLHPETLSSIVLAWPGDWGEVEGIAEVMQDIPKDAQRIVLGSFEEEVAGLVERYARRALTVAAPGLTGEIEPAGVVRTVSVPWSRRLAAIPELIELLDPASLAIWTLDLGHLESIKQAIGGADHAVEVTTGDVSRAQTIIAFDPPTPPRLRQLVGAGEVVLLTPSSTERYVRRIAATRRPLRLSGALDAAATAAETRRATIAGVVEKGSLDRALLTLAPLLERYDGAAVAAALFELWSAGGTTPAAAPPVPELPTVKKVYVGIGKKDGATVNDLVAVLTKEVRIDKSLIGRVELREGFMLVEIPAQDADRVAEALNRTTIRRKRVTARVDRGATDGAAKRGKRRA
jgi:ATP-dependent RNA helicase DeaD